MPRRLRIEDYPWDTVDATKAFIRQLFAGPPPGRPAAILHCSDGSAPEPSPEGLTALQQQVWHATQAIRARPVGGDDYVPALATGAGTCALATAFGCQEIEASGVRWVKPVITSPDQIDSLRKPKMTAGRLGEVLEQTRAYADCADERLAIQIMDFQSPFTTVEQLVGGEAFFLMPHDHPARLHALMDLVTDFAIEFFRAQIEAAGPACSRGSWPPIWFPAEAGIQMSDDNLVNVSPETYEEFVVPYNNRIARAFGGLFLHSCTIREAHLPVLKKLERLTGLNCDISSSVPIATLSREFGDRAVIAPHAYINTGGRYRGYREFMEDILAPWHPGQRLFIYPCTVLYLPDEAREIAFDEPAARAVLDRLPAWRQAHGRGRNDGDR
ncbi:MAG TPA: uroporphyrinogen decarboxylase family protein [Planctomycetota bacterium]|nr:uroporphyrinogen decarboxylase family protein [Planctomycetota bacterium]HRR79031.1 uroporphyrinogen decarboxylase family protein [Planctomycetota bacterium]HRT95500.1 uroporphyrinogen decarboxylase family protein [Planctomycetota bacterium]